jgi:vacuolar-type H+-ATPase subunit I/STV1
MSAPELAALYESLKQASERQVATLAADDQTGFAHASDEREKLFQAIQRRESELPKLPPRTRAHVRQLIQTILTTDGQLQQALTEASERTLEELSALQSGMHALQSYGSESRAPAYYIDKSS